MIDPKDVTIIIPHLGADEQQEYSLDQCVKSLEETAPNIRGMVVTNGRKGFCKHRGTVDLTEQGQNRAVNAAVATTNTPWIFISNDDMIYPPGWFEKMDFGMTDAQKCISPILVEPRKGAPTFIEYFCGGAGGDFDKEKWLDFAKNYKHLEGDRWGFNLPLLIERELWDTIGGYDINYDPWGSNGDSDLEYKIKLAGVQPFQNTYVPVYHFSQTSGTFNPANDSHRFRNYAYFKEKWGFDRTDDGIWEASFAMPTKEEGRIFCPPWENTYGGNA